MIDKGNHWKIFTLVSQTQHNQGWNWKQNSIVRGWTLFTGQSSSSNFCGWFLSCRILNDQAVGVFKFKFTIGWWRPLDDSVAGVHQDEACPDSLSFSDDNRTTNLERKSMITLSHTRDKFKVNNNQHLLMECAAVNLYERSRSFLFENRGFAAPAAAASEDIFNTFIEDLHTHTPPSPPPKIVCVVGRRRRKS